MTDKAISREGEAVTIKFNGNGVIPASKVPAAITTTAGTAVDIPVVDVDGASPEWWQEQYAPPYNIIGEFDEEANVYKYTPTKSITVYAQAIRTITVTFDANGGTFYNNEGTATEGETEEEETVTTFVKTYLSASWVCIGDYDLFLPTRKDYLFNGWWTTSEGADSVKVNKGTFVTEDATYYAHWIPNESETPKEDVYVNLCFDANGGTFRYDTKKLYRQKLYDSGSTNTIESTPPVPVLNGQVFDFWSFDKDGTNRVNESTTLEWNEEGCHIYAQWTPSMFEMTFDPAGGSSVDPIFVQYGDHIYDIPESTKEGHSLDGWYTSVGLKLDSDMAWERETKFTARWNTNKYTISFDSNGGTDVNPITGDYDTGVTVPPNPTKVGYNFKKWNPTVPPEFPSSDMTCVAQWELIPYTITYVMNGHGNQLPDESYTVESRDFYPPIPTTNDEWIFLGWNPSKIPHGSTENQTFTANWEPQGETDITITFNEDGETRNIKAPAETQIYLPEPNDSWWMENTEPPYYRVGQLDTETEKYVYVLTKQITVYAHLRQTYTIEFDANGGQFDESVQTITQTYLQGEWVSLCGKSGNELPQPSKKGYLFDGWWTEKLGGDRVHKGTFAVEDATYYAHWSDDFNKGVETNYYTTIQYDANDGVFPYNETKLTKYILCDDSGYSEIGNFPEHGPKRTNYTFDGWYWDERFRKIVESNEKVGSKMTHVAYAKWKPIPIEMTFKDGEHEYQRITIDYGGNIDNIPELARSEQTFDGWYTKPNGYGKLLTPGQHWETATTFYANWTSNIVQEGCKYDTKYRFKKNQFKKQIGVTFKYNIEGNSELDKTQLFDCDFIGWSREPRGEVEYLEDEEFMNLTYVNGDTVTLYAQWENPVVTLPTPRPKSGCEFLGWSKVDKGVHGVLPDELYDNDTMTNLRANIVGQDGDEYVVSNNITLYAVWLNNRITITLDRNYD